MKRTSTENHLFHKPPIYSRKRQHCEYLHEAGKFLGSDTHVNLCRRWRELRSNEAKDYVSVWNNKTLCAMQTHVSKAWSGRNKGRRWGKATHNENNTAATVPTQHLQEKCCFARTNLWWPLVAAFSGWNTNRCLAAVHYWLPERNNYYRQQWKLFRKPTMNDTDVQSFACKMRGNLRLGAFVKRAHDALISRNINLIWYTCYVPHHRWGKCALR